MSESPTDLVPDPSGLVRLVVGVDFASRHSAFALMYPDCELVRTKALDFGSETEGFQENLKMLKNAALALKNEVRLAGETPEETVVVLENLTAFMTRSAHTLRLQGAFRAMLFLLGFNRVVMIMPSTWQNFYGWHKTVGTTSKGFAKFACDVLDLQPTEPTVGKETVDVRDAILIARWYVETELSNN